MLTNLAGPRVQIKVQDTRLRRATAERHKGRERRIFFTINIQCEEEGDEEDAA